MVVYKATNNINGKQYVGFTTKTLEERSKTHLYKSRHTKGKHYNYIFLNAIRKYGFENFTWEIIYTCNSIEECWELEIKSIAEYNTLAPNGYNLTKGGNGGPLSQISLNKMSASLKKHYQINGWTDPLTKEQRSDNAKKAHITKKNSNYKYPSFKHTTESKKLISTTKNIKNKINWINSKTNETISLSLTDMSKYTGLSIGTFNHLKRKIQIETKCGWRLG